MAIKWFQLVDVAGVAMTNVDGVAVDTAMVAMLQDAVKTKYADSHLTGIAPSDVVVFANRSDFSAKRAPLEFDDSIDALGEFPKDPLVVQVPPVHGPGFPAFSPLENADSFTSECGSLTTWEVGVVHDIPLIYELMKPLGGCTSNGKIFWRWEDQQLAALLLSGWFPESYPHVIKHLANKISIVVGSCGVGKSTLLCVLAFFVVLRHKKNVLVYRRLLDKGSENALLYLGWEQGRVVFISLPDCSDAWAANIYKSLRGTRNVVGHSARPRVDVWLDGFVYKHVPKGLPFAVLTTSQGVDLKSQDRDYAYRCLFPSWCRKDLFALGRAVFNFDDKEMEDRFYYSGGSVGDFAAPTVQNIEDAISAAVRSVTDPAKVLQSRPFVFVTNDQANRFQHTFLTGKVEEDEAPTTPLLYVKYWEQVVDSEYAVSLLNLNLRPDALYRIFEWTRRAAYTSLASVVFEIYTHRVAARYRLTLFVSEYTPAVSSTDVSRYPDRFLPLTLLRGQSQCSGKSNAYGDALTAWRDAKEMTY